MSKKKRKQRHLAVDYRQFVELWRTCATVGEVAKKLGVRPNTCSNIANRLRKKGVKLRKFPRRAAQPVDVKQLNKGYK